LSHAGGVDPSANKKINTYTPGWLAGRASLSDSDLDSASGCAPGSGHDGGAFGKSKPQVVIQTNGQMAGLMNNSDFKLHLCKCGCSQIFATSCRVSPGKREPEWEPPVPGSPETGEPPKPVNPRAMHLQLNAPKAASFCANAQFVCVNTFVSRKMGWWDGGGWGVPILMGFVLINANIKNPIDKTAR